MAGAPPPRYRVVERGRRLEVIDTWAGGRPAARAIPEPRAQSRDLAAPASRSGAAIAARKLGKTSFRTQAWYDDKGPRELLLDSEGERLMDRARSGFALGLVIVALVGIFWWWLLVPLLFLTVFNKQGRTATRAAVTRWLDGLDQATSASPSNRG